MPPRGRTASGVSRRGASPWAATKSAPWMPALSTSLSEPMRARRWPSGDQARPAMLERPRRPELGLASIGGDDVGLAVRREVPVIQAGGGEGDARAVGRPGGHVVVPVAVGELAGVAACDVDDEGVPVGVAAPADGVAAVLDAPDDADPGRLLVVVVVGGLVRVDVGDVGHAGGVGRPGELGDAGGGGGEAAGLAAVGGDEPDLASALVVGAEEGDGGAVGGEAWGAVLGAGGEGVGIAIGQVHEEHLGAGLARLAVHPGAGEGEAGAVGGDGGVGDGGEFVDDVRGDGAGHGTPPGVSGIAGALYHSRAEEGRLHCLSWGRGRRSSVG